PWKYHGKIMTDQPPKSSTHHGGVIDYKGKSYLFYHTCVLPEGGSYGRSSAIEEFTYNHDGPIPVIRISKVDVQPVGTTNHLERNEAETIAWSEKCTTAEKEIGNVYVTGIRTGGFTGAMIGLYATSANDIKVE